MRSRLRPATIDVWKLVGGVWEHRASVACLNVDAGERARYVAQVTFAEKGEWRFQALHPADSKHAKTAGGYRQLTVQ